MEEFLSLPGLLKGEITNLKLGKWGKDANRKPEAGDRMPRILKTYAFRSPVFLQF